MDFRDTYLTIKELFSPYRKNIIIISIIMGITSLCGFVNPWVTKQLIDIGIMQSEFSETIRYVALLAIIFLVQQLFSLVQYYYFNDISVKIPYDLNNKACKHILLIKIKYFKEKNFSEVVTELFQDIANISSLANIQFLTSFVALFKLVAGIVALLFINWKLAIIIIIAIPVRALFSSILFMKQESIYKVIMKVQSKFSAWLGDGISGIAEIKVFGIIDKKLTNLKAILEESKKLKSRLMFFQYIDSMLSSTISTCFTCLLYLFGALMIFKDELTLGSLVSFISYSSIVFEPITIITYLATQLSTIKPALERFHKFIDSESEIDTPDSVMLPSSMDIEHIDFNNVSLVYDEEKTLDQVNFTINKGEKVAIIGFNGSGKTSIINLLLRFYEPTEGSITVNGCDIKSYTFESYRSIWSVMAQNNYLFNDTIRNNINIYGDLSEDDIVCSCKKAEAYSFIQKLPEKLDTRIGYNGSKLSGGEKQKVALARALARKNTKVLILDEATSNYDYHSEQIFNSEIISSNRYDITILITHRPEVLKRLDKIIYLEKGKVVSIGTFDEIYKSQDNFRDMVLNCYEEEKKNAFYAVSN